MTQDLVIKLCILCQLREASTREHLYKADLYELITGDGRSLILTDDSNDIKEADTKDDVVLKPVRNLCPPCNNTASQKADRAISRIQKDLQTNWRVPGNKASEADLMRRYGQGSLVQLKRYFAKLFACRLDKGGLPIPDVLREIFLHSTGLEKLQITVWVDDEISEAWRGKYPGPNISHPLPHMRTLPLMMFGGDPNRVRAGELPGRYTFGLVISDIRYDVAVDCG